MPNHVKRNIEIVQYVEANWKSGIRIKELAQRFNLDASDVERIFREIKGTTIKRYIDENRKTLLLETLKRGNEYGYQFARSIGIENNQSFSHWVRRMFGISFKELSKKYEGEL